ncbi:General transcription factor 3C polypeptide 6 [Branchiostoma belcheri]|nr:General transcription factor 3C polypeptide 6 [Branchiostoma belcheri]
MAQKQDEAGEEEYEEIEDESLVLVELTGIMDTEFLRTGSGQCKFVGIDSEQPVLQIDRYIFTGSYEDAVGTCVMFEEGSQEEEDQQTYMCHTAKKLTMTRSFLTSKNDDTDSMSFLREDTPHHRRALKIASSCTLHVKPDKAASKGVATEGRQEPNRTERTSQGTGDVEMVEDVENITETSKQVESHVEDSDDRIGERTQLGGDRATTETGDREKETALSDR